MRGASSMVKKVRTAIVAKAMMVEAAAAPTDRAVAGLSTWVICEENFDEFSERYFCRCNRKTSLPIGPLPFLVSEIRFGSCRLKWPILVTSGSANR